MFNCRCQEEVGEQLLGKKIDCPEEEESSQ